MKDITIKPKPVTQEQFDRALLRQSLAERVKYPSRRTSDKRTPLGALLRGQAKRRQQPKVEPGVIDYIEALPPMSKDLKELFDFADELDAANKRRSK